MTTASIVDAWRYISAFPLPVSGRILHSSISSGFLAIESVWRQRCLQRNQWVHFTRKSLVNVDNLSAIHCFVQELTENVRKWSFDDKVVVSVRKAAPLKRSGELSEGSSGIQSWIDVWDVEKGCKSDTFDCKQDDLHGSIVNNAAFGAFSLSADHGQLLYLAEERLKTTSFFKQHPKEDELVGNQFLWRQNWGEQMQECYRPVICTYQIGSGRAPKVLDLLPPEFGVSEACWVPDGSGIVCVGLNEKPWKLGRFACYNRPTAVFYLPSDGQQCDRLTSGYDLMQFSIRFSPDGSKFAYLQTSAKGAHFQCAKLMLMDWKTRSVNCCLDVVDRPKIGNGFPGLFATALPDRTWHQNGRHLLVNSIWRSENAVVCVDAALSNSATRLPVFARGSMSLLDQCQRYLLASYSAPDRPPLLVIGILADDDHNPFENFNWVAFVDEKRVDLIDRVLWKTFDLTPPVEQTNAEFPNLNFDAILIQPKREDKAPVVLAAHGGPHSVFCSEWNCANSALYALLGFAVVCVNYRGSRGFGQHSIDCLPGWIGKQDVNDCKFALDQVLLAEPRLDHSRIYCFGASHGGLIALSLISIYPGNFRACVAVNPVTNVVAKYYQTDIPDLNVFEALGLDSLPTGNPLHPEQLEQLWNCSPIRHLAAETRPPPILLVVGGSDVRVPAAHSHEFIRLLQRRQVELRVLRYSDNGHSICQVDAESDCVVNQLLWLLIHW